MKNNHSTIFKSLADTGSLDLFNRIAVGNNKIKSLELQKESNLTRKQYYSRVSRLVKTGAVRRKNGIIRLTAYGKIIFNIVQVEQKASLIGFRLKAIDHIFDDKNLPEGVKIDMIAALVEDKELQRIIIK